MSEAKSKWLELESDPGLFTLLVDDFGVKGVQVEEVYDLSKPLDNTIYGFIFLFKWTERRTRRSRAPLEAINYVTDINIVNNMFFARQVIPNSCATHALLSILLNCGHLELGGPLKNFQDDCTKLTPEEKGQAIGNNEQLFKAHNSYAKPELKAKKLDKNQVATTTLSSSSLASSSAQAASEVFHYICFVPINDHLYELDGLKPYPIDHGLIDKNENWTEKFKQIIAERINVPSNGSGNGTHSSAGSQTHLPSNYNQAPPSSQQQSYSNVQSNGYVNMNQQQQQQNTEIRFNLMALVPDKLKIYKQQLDKLTANRAKLLDTFENLIKSEPTTDETPLTAEDTNTRQLRSRTSSNQLGQQPSSTTTTVNVNTLSTKLEALCSDNSFTFKIKLENECYLNGTDAELTNGEFNLTNDFEIVRQLAVETTNNGHPHDTALVDSSFKCKDLVDLDKRIQSEIQYYEGKCKEEIEKRNKYKVDAMRRKHHYDAFIVTYLRMLAANGKLTKLIQAQFESLKKRKTSHLTAATGAALRLSTNRIKKRLKKK